MLICIVRRNPYPKELAIQILTDYFNYISALYSINMKKAAVSATNRPISKRAGKTAK